MAADGAAPGDALFGIDRALEKIGIGAGHAEERLDEARTLLSEGEASEALRHATEVLTEEDEGSDVADARDALEDAAVVIEGGEPSNSQTQEDVTALLDYIRANRGTDIGADGKEFGQGVADRAHDIKNDDSGPPTSKPVQGNDNGQSQGGGNQGGGNGNGGDQTPETRGRHPAGATPRPPT